MSYFLSHLPGCRELPPVRVPTSCSNSLNLTSSSIWGNALPPVAASSMGATWPLAYGPQSRVPRGSWYTKGHAIEAQWAILMSTPAWLQEQRAQQMRLLKTKQ